MTPLAKKLTLALTLVGAALWIKRHSSSYSRLPAPMRRKIRYLLELGALAYLKYAPYIHEGKKFYHKKRKQLIAS
ncbi:MAG: hypothetical protein AB7G80_08580 [Dongiaceae bacterium]